MWGCCPQVRPALKYKVMCAMCVQYAETFSERGSLQPLAVCRQPLVGVLSTDAPRFLLSYDYFVGPKEIVGAARQLEVYRQRHVGVISTGAPFSSNLVLCFVGPKEIVGAV
jgi:hypothetical protein